MKTNINLLLIFILTVFAVTAVKAQRSRSHESGNRDRGNSNVYQERERGTERDRSSNFSRRPYSNSGSETRSVRANNYRNLSANHQRNEVALLDNRSRHNAYSVTQQRVYRPNTVERERYGNRTVYNSYNSYNNYNTYNRGKYYPHFFMQGPRYRVIPRSFISINFGGNPYYYNEGLFYGLYGSYYQPLFPPPGIRIRVLPFGYNRIYVGVNPFFYFNGIFYRHRDKENYEVVDAPMGATVSSLPKGAKSVSLNGEKLYELNGTYFKEDRDYKGKTVYTVVGKNGEVNNSATDNDSSNIVPPAPLDNGNIINELPDGSKVVTINGDKLYVTPDDVYLKAEYEGNTVHYKVVGK